MANKDGGTHIDPGAAKAYELLRDIGDGMRLDGSRPQEEIPLVAMRQIAHEVTRTIEAEFGVLLERDALTPTDALPLVVARRAQRNDACPCGSGLKYKACHG